MTNNSFSLNKLTAKNILILSALILIFVLVLAALISKSNTNYLSQAYQTENLASGCYYQLNCPPVNNSVNRPLFKCTPLLVCPTPTSSPTPTIPKTSLSCNDCLAENISNLCFNPVRKISYCSNTIEAGSDTVCTVCTSPTPVACITPPPCLKGIKQPDGSIIYCDPKPLPSGVSYCSYNPTPPVTSNPQLCLQQFTWGRNSVTGECKLFPSSCLPDGWGKDNSCNLTPTPYPSRCHWETICDPAFPTEGCRPKQIQVCP